MARSTGARISPAHRRPRLSRSAARGRNIERRRTRRDADRGRGGEAATEVIATAETLQAGVAKALLGKAVLPDDLPFATGQIGLLGTKASYKLMANATPC